MHERKEFGWQSPCHPSAQVCVDPVWVVHPSGRTEEVGKAAWCPWSGWINNKREECFGLVRLLKSYRNWPQDLTGVDFDNLARNGGPCYWRGMGYNIARKNGLWVNLREIDNFPPYESEDQLDDMARRALAMRKPELRAAIIGSIKNSLPAEPEPAAAADEYADVEIPF